MCFDGEEESARRLGNKERLMNEGKKHLVTLKGKDDGIESKVFKKLGMQERREFWRY